jgi:hypothetical protein
MHPTDCLLLATVLPKKHCSPPAQVTCVAVFSIAKQQTAAAACTLPCFACYLQKCALQAGVPIEASVRLAHHTVDEAKRNATNSTYELSNITAAALKLVSTPKPASSPCHKLCTVVPLPAPM